MHKMCSCSPERINNTIYSEFNLKKYYISIINIYQIIDVLIYLLFTCSITEFFFTPADVNDRLILDTLRNDCDPSIPKLNANL